MTFSLNPSLIRNRRLRLFAGFRCLVLPLVGLVFPFAGRLPVGAGGLPLEGGIGFPLGAALRLEMGDRKSVVSGKSVDLGGRRLIKKKNTYVVPLAST